MEHYLTRKARPNPLVVLVEIVLFAPLAFWCCISGTIFFEEYLHQLNWAVVAAFLLLLGVPLLVCGYIIRRWYMRSKARRVAAALAWESADQVSWELFEQHADVRNVRAALEKLWAGKYLRNVALDFDGLKLRREDEPAQGVPNGGKCPMCGASMERRTFGGWACRYCGTVAGRN